MVSHKSCRLFSFFFILFCLPVLFQRTCLQVQKSFILLDLVCKAIDCIFSFHPLNCLALRASAGSFYDICIFTEFLFQILFSWFHWLDYVYYLISHWVSLRLFFFLSFHIFMIGVYYWIIIISLCRWHVCLHFMVGVFLCWFLCIWCKSHLFQFYGVALLVWIYLYEWVLDVSSLGYIGLGSTWMQ